MNTVEIIELTFEILVVPTVLGVVGLIWKKVIKPVVNMVRGHDYLVESVKEIKGELTTNGGSSIKDAINRIESRQIIVDHRTKAIFYNFEKPIFEIDHEGNILWSNEKFKTISEYEDFKGLDWISIFDEPCRPVVLTELQSCLKDNRELKINAKSISEKPVSLRGFPYRDQKKNHGFLVYFNLGE